MIPIIYSLHKPLVKYYMRGREHKILSLAIRLLLVIQSTVSILGALNFPKELKVMAENWF